MTLKFCRRKTLRVLQLLNTQWFNIGEDLACSKITNYTSRVSVSHEYENIFWYVAPCSLVEFYRFFRGTCCLHHQGDESLIVLMMAAIQPRRYPSGIDRYFRDAYSLMIEAASTFGTSVTSARLHGATHQKTVIFIFVAVRT
jgi:hypothetical protein